MLRNSLIALLIVAGCASGPAQPSTSVVESDVDRKADFALAAGMLPALRPGETQSCMAIDNWALCCNGTAPPAAPTAPTQLTITVDDEALVIDDVDADLKRTCCCACNQHGCDCDCGPVR